MLGGRCRAQDALHGRRWPLERLSEEDGYRYLLGNAESSYKRFHDLHTAFLDKHGMGATERQRKRPYHFLQEVGLECAVWPHLYWSTAMTETFEQ